MTRAGPPAQERTRRESRRRQASGGLLVLASLLLFLAPADPGPSGGAWFGVPVPDAPHLDKLVHAVMFLLLGYTLRPLVAPSGPRGDATTFVALVVYGALIELAQSGIPGRSASAADTLADAVGAVGGLLLHRFR